MSTGAENAYTSDSSRPDASVSESPIDIDGSPDQTEVEELEVDPSIIPLTSRHTSKAWDHFKQKKLGESIKAECNYCKKLLAGGRKAGTTHLRQHTNGCAKRVCQDIRQSRLFGAPTNSSMGCMRSETLTLSPYEFHQEDGRRDLAQMIILHEYPMSMVEHYGFRAYSKTLQPGFKVPCRNTTKKDILTRYGTEKDNIVALLKKVKGRFALTTDMWTATNQRKGYMALTAHFIDNTWKLQSRIIRFLYVPAPHTKEVLSECLLNCIYSWNLDLRVSSITVDNCTTNDAMMEIIYNRLPRSSLLLGGRFLHMRCAAHILNLIVQDGLSVIGGGVERVRDSVAFWTASDKRVQKFEEVAKEYTPSVTKKLELDCKTRWNSTFDMLRVARMYKEVFTILGSRESTLFRNPPNEDDWLKVDKICDRLKVFSDATHDFSASKYPTANVYFPKICEIKLELRNWLLCDDQVIRKMAHSMLEKYDKYWVFVNGLMGVATILDPRYKMALVHFYFGKIYNEFDAQDEVERIRSLLKDLVTEYTNKQTKQSASSTMPPPGAFNSGGASYMFEFAQFMERSQNFNEEKSDLDAYLGCANIPLVADFDILKWWKTNGSQYPVLQQIARDILSIPVSTVPSESAFSTSGRVLSPYRSRLLPETVEALMCAQNWIWADIGGSGAFKEMEYSELMEEVEEVHGDFVKEAAGGL